MQQAEVTKIANNAWKIQIEGRNRKGTFGVWFPTAEANDLIVNHPDEYRLLSFLQGNNHPDSTFWIANALAEKFGWGFPRLRAARTALIEMGYFRRIRSATNNQPALYRWLPRPKRGEENRSGGLVEDRCSIQHTPTSVPKTLAEIRKAMGYRQ